MSSLAHSSPEGGASIPTEQADAAVLDPRRFVEDVAAVPLDQIDLDYLWRDVVYGRGSLSKATRRDAGSAIRTLKAILAAAIRRREAYTEADAQVGILRQQNAPYPPETSAVGEGGAET